MVKHIILWNLKDDFSDEEKVQIKENAKINLESLVGQIPGLIDMNIQTTYFESSNVDLMLDSTFENVDALKQYAIHPKHMEMADKYVRPYTANRSCIDYEI